MAKYMRRYERIMEQHSEVKAWLKNRPLNTQKAFAERLMNFCEAVGVEPEEWRHMDKFEARDLAWKYVEPLTKDRAAMAKQTMAALKSWFRNLDGEKLPLDSGRGGKHNIRYILKKAAYEKIPNKEEVYGIVDMASSLRDKAILSMLFCAGIRVNALLKFLYGHVADQLENDIIILKITWDIDDKLKGTNVPFYYTFLNGEAAVTLRQYCELKHKRSKPDTPLFYTKTGRPVSYSWVYQIVKMCIARAGFDPKTMWVHSLRKSFRKVVRQANIDDDDKEQLMGHVIRGSREAYFDRKDVELIREAYQKCNFSRELPRSETQKLRKQLERERLERTNLESMVTAMRREMEELKEGLKELKASS